MQAFDLNQIHVKSPCTVPWETMTGDDRTRFCRQCKLNVFNLEGMTRAEAEELLQAREGRLCLRFVRRADGTILTRDCGPVRAARARRMLALAAAGAIVLFVQAMSWIARRGARGENLDTHQSFLRAQASHVYQSVPVVQKAVNWAQQQVNAPPPPRMVGKMAEMGDVSYEPVTPFIAPPSQPTMN